MCNPMPVKVLVPLFLRFGRAVLAVIWGSSLKFVQKSFNFVMIDHILAISSFLQKSCFCLWLRREPQIQYVHQGARSFPSAARSRKIVSSIVWARKRITRANLRVCLRKLCFIDYNVTVFRDSTVFKSLFNQFFVILITCDSSTMNRLFMSDVILNEFVT